jgi:flagellar basal body-associated protein FliL
MRDKKILIIVVVVLVVALGLITYWFVRKGGSLPLGPQPTTPEEPPVPIGPVVPTPEEPVVPEQPTPTPEQPTQQTPQSD